MSDQARRPSWRVRNRLAAVVLAFCFATVAYVLWTGLNTEPAEVATNMAFVGILGVVGAYFGSSTIENKLLDAASEAVSR